MAQSEKQQQPPIEMAINFILDSIEIANKRGAFSLDESAQIWAAKKQIVDTFNQGQPQQMPQEPMGPHLPPQKSQQSNKKK